MRMIANMTTFHQRPLTYECTIGHRTYFSNEQNIYRKASNKKTPWQMSFSQASNSTEKDNLCIIQYNKMKNNYDIQKQTTFNL